MPDVEISGFCDEICEDKNLEQQFAVASALGMRCVSLRFFNLAGAVKNIIEASDFELDQIAKLLEKYGLSASSIGSPLGKVKLLDRDDGSANSFRPFPDYLSHEVNRICQIAVHLNVRLIRGFSFYHPRGDSATMYVEETARRLREIAELCAQNKLVYGLEVEANLVGQTGPLVGAILRSANHPALVSIFDGANLTVQGFDEAAISEQWLAMRPSIGWLHVKDYRRESNLQINRKEDNEKNTEIDRQRITEVDEDSLRGFVPVGRGESGYRWVLKDLKDHLSAIRRRIGFPDSAPVVLDLEPHLRKGGQFGGFSGPDGFGVALRSLCRLLDEVGLSFALRDWPLG